MPADHRAAAGLPYLIMSGLLWGTGGFTGTLLARAAGLSSLAVAAYRLAIGGILLVVLVSATRARWPSGRESWRRIAAVGTLAALFQGSYFSAVGLTSVSLATLITIGCVPVVVLAVEWITGRRKVRGRDIGITCLALCGLALLVGMPSGGYSHAATLASAGFALLAGTGFAVVTLISATPVAGLDDLAVTGFGFTLGGAILLPVAAAAGGAGLRPGLVAVSLLLALGTGPTAVAYSLFFRGLRTAPASTAALLTLLEPLTGTLLAVCVLGDRLGASGIAGALTLGVAVTLAARAAT